MKIYKCKICGFKTGSRTKIRRHIREKHGIKGRKPYRGQPSPVTEAYTTEEV